MDSSKREYKAYPSVAAIVNRTTVPSRDLSVPTGDWRAWFMEQMCDHVDGLRFGDDEFLYIDDEEIAFYDFLPIEGAKARLGKESWFSLEYQCPWLAEPLGFFTWMQYISHPCEDWFHESIQRVAWGWIANLNEGEVRQSVAEVEYSLSDALEEGDPSEGGFFRGEDFLSLQGTYMEYAAEQVRAALREAGYTAPVYTTDLEGILELGLTPIFFDAAEVRTLDGRTLERRQVRRLYRELRERKVKIWSFDRAILKDRHFWLT
jgi:hypothetical protein